MIDRERVLAKLDELDGYLAELKEVLPESFEEYQESVASRRACERLLQISVECVLDVCSLVVTGRRLGLPSEENDVIEKLERAGVLSSELAEMLGSMRGFRNLIVHEYGRVDDSIVHSIATTRLQDFAAFKSAILQTLRSQKPD